MGASAAAIAAIEFDRHKYGGCLHADACEVASLPDFIKTPRPHRLGFYEVALVTAGRGAIVIDGVPVEIAPRRLCVTAPGEIRSWRLEGERLEGMLAFFEADLFHEVFADPRFVEKLPLVNASPAERALLPEARRFDALVDIVGAMTDELRAPDVDTAHVLRARTYELLIALQRASGARTRVAGPRAESLVLRFTRLVEERHRLNEPLGRYADRLGVSPRHLNQCVRAGTGTSASERIQRRLHLEARRLLLGSALSVGAIAEALGFSDAPYFIRSFKRRAGVTPGRFRAAQQKSSF